VLAGQHTLVENPAYQDFFSGQPIQQDVLAVFDTSIATPNLVAGPAYPGIQSNPLAAVDEACNITSSLCSTPCVHRIVGNSLQVFLCEIGEMVGGHPLDLSCALEYAALDSSKDSIWSDTTGFPGDDCFPQCCQTEFLLLLVSLKRTQTGANYLTRIVISPALDLHRNEFIEFGGQTNVARRHGSLLL
jgi:hypothetical protein